VDQIGHRGVVVRPKPADQLGRAPPVRRAGLHRAGAGFGRAIQPAQSFLAENHIAGAGLASGAASACHLGHYPTQVSRVERLGQDGHSGRDLAGQPAGDQDAALGKAGVLSSDRCDQVGPSSVAQVLIDQQHVVADRLHRRGLRDALGPVDFTAASAQYPLDQLAHGRQVVYHQDSLDARDGLGHDRHLPGRPG
jgi:hypothetical protein